MEHKKLWDAIYFLGRQLESLSQRLCILEKAGGHIVYPHPQPIEFSEYAKDDDTPSYESSLVQQKAE